MKNKLKSKGLWLSLSGAVIVLMQTVGVKFDVAYVNEVISAVCSLLIVVGIMVDDRKKLEQITKTTIDESVDDSQFCEIVDGDKNDKEKAEESVAYITDYLN